MGKIREAFMVVVGTGVWSKNRTWSVRRKKEGVSGEERKHADQKLRRSQADVGPARKWSQKQRVYEERVTSMEAGWKGSRAWWRPQGPAWRASLIDQSPEHFGGIGSMLWELTDLDSCPDRLLAGSVVWWSYLSSYVSSSSSVKCSNITSYDHYEGWVSYWMLHGTCRVGFTQ